MWLLGSFTTPAQALMSAVNSVKDQQTFHYNNLCSDSPENLIWWPWMPSPCILAAVCGRLIECSPGAIHFLRRYWWQKQCTLCSYLSEAFTVWSGPHESAGLFSGSCSALQLTCMNFLWSLWHPSGTSSRSLLFRRSFSFWAIHFIHVRFNHL